jgi:uncharacterized protein YjiS (DUF1127 family)
MSITIARPAPHRPAPHSPAREPLLRRWLAAAATNWRRRKAIAALQALDDRILRDIGIHRGDIWRVVDGFDERELRMVPLAPDSAPAEAPHAHDLPEPDPAERDLAERDLAEPLRKAA